MGVHWARQSNLQKNKQCSSLITNVIGENIMFCVNNQCYKKEYNALA